MTATKWMYRWVSGYVGCVRLAAVADAMASAGTAAVAALLAAASCVSSSGSTSRCSAMQQQQWQH